MNILDIHARDKHIPDLNRIKTARKRLPGYDVIDLMADFFGLLSDPTRLKIVFVLKNDELCVQCGNCQRCPYLAINYNDSGYPQTDAEKCIGCKMCNYLCFTGALSMRERTVHELTVLKEN